MPPKTRSLRGGTALGPETLGGPLPELDPASFGEALVGDTRQNDLCRARIWVSDGVVIDAAIEFIAAEPPTGAVDVLLSFLKGRPYAEVLDAVTARSCASDGCSSVEGKCFSLMQETVYRALGDWERKFGNPPGARVLGTPAGGIDLGGRVVPPRHTPAPEPDIAAWAASLIAPADPYPDDAPDPRGRR
ncbi:MAG: hypothetical protein ABI743_06835 [bacterium]